MAINTQEFLPLREPTFFILLSIAEEQKHGYAILQDVETLSAGKIKLSNGTLYGALTRLQGQGLIHLRQLALRLDVIKIRYVHQLRYLPCHRGYDLRIVIGNERERPDTRIR